MPRYDPWTDLATRFTGVDVVCRHRLGGDVVGALRGNRIWLDKSLGQSGRRSTLAHEIVHLERGAPVGDERARRREEMAVEEIAARRLVALGDLSDAVRWEPGGSEASLAELLWVDVDILRTRIATLTPQERRVVVASLERPGLE